MGRVLDQQGKLPKPWIESYKNEDTMKQLWDIALAEAIKHKTNIVQFWNGENDAQAAFRTNGCTLGLTWDSTGYNLGKDLPIAYISPKEGAFGWLQGFMLMKNAKNVDQGHEWAKFISTTEGSAEWANVVLGQSNRQGRHRTDGSGCHQVLQRGLSGRRAVEAVVVAVAAGLVHEAARRIRRQVEGRLSLTSSNWPPGERPAARLALLIASRRLRDATAPSVQTTGAYERRRSS